MMGAAADERSKHMDNSTPSKAAEYLAQTREELVQREIRFNSAFKVNAAEIGEACRQSRSDLHQTYKEMLLKHFVRAVRSLTGGEPPKEYYPEMVDIFAKDMHANMEALPSLEAKDMMANTIRYGAVATKLQKDFPVLDNGAIVETAMRGYMKPHMFLAGIQYNYDRLRKHFPDEEAYPGNILVHKAYRETVGIGVEAAAKTSDEKLFAGVRARNTTPPDHKATMEQAQHAEAMANARDTLLSAKRPKRPVTSAVIQTILTNNIDTVDAIRRKVDDALGDESRRMVAQWQDRLAQKGTETPDKQK